MTSFSSNQHLLLTSSVAPRTTPRLEAFFSGDQRELVRGHAKKLFTEHDGERAAIITIGLTRGK